MIIFSGGIMMISNDFIDNLYGKTVSILGLGISNMPLMRVLVKFGATVTGFDKKSEDKIDKRIKDELFHHNVPCVLGEDYLDHIDADYIFRTPESSL